MSELIEYGVFQTKIEKYDCKCEKLDVFYNRADSRCWTAIINPQKECIFVTCHLNQYEYGDVTFEIVSSEKTVDADVDDVYQIIELIINNQYKI